MKQLIFLTLMLYGFVSAGQDVKSCDCCKELKEAFKNAKTGTAIINGHGRVATWIGDEERPSMPIGDIPITTSGTITLVEPNFRGRNEVGEIVDTLKDVSTSDQYKRGDGVFVTLGSGLRYGKGVISMQESITYESEKTGILYLKNSQLKKSRKATIIYKTKESTGRVIFRAFDKQGNNIPLEDILYIKQSNK